MILVEGDLQINFTNAMQVLKFDQPDKNHAEYHDISKMPRVDFIIECIDSIFFIEIKDTSVPNAADVGNQKFWQKVSDATLNKSLVEKYLYTFFFRWAECSLEKSVHYVSLITIESALLNLVVDPLNKSMKHFSQKSTRWSRDPLVVCEVHNLETWKMRYPQWPVARLSAQSQVSAGAAS